MNKPVNHKDLDNAIKSSLLNAPAETKIEWEEIYAMLPKKSAVVKGPLADISFSLNSFAGVAAAGSGQKLKSALLFVKKGTIALYITLGTVVIGTGSYFIYSSFFKNTSSLDKLVTPAREIQVVSTPEAKPVAQQPDPTIINNAPSIIQETTTIATDPAKAVSGHEVTENPNASEDMPLLKTPSKHEKVASVAIDEPVQLKTGDTSQNAAYDFSPNPAEVVKSDTISNSTQQNVEPKKGKVLYYKESLSLDKLEQQISTDKNRKDISPPKEK